MSSSKKLTCKGTLRQVFISSVHHRLEIHSVMLVFSTQLYELLPLQPSLWFNSHPPLSLGQSTLYTDIVWLGGGGGWWVLLDSITCRSLTLCLTRFRTYKIARPPPTKNLGEEGASDRKTCRKVPLQDNYLRWLHFALVSILLTNPCSHPSKRFRRPISSLTQPSK
jgi:hypothetical protein